MKPIVITSIFVALLCGATSVSAEGHERRGHKIKRMIKMLDLDDAQQEDVRAVFKTARQSCKTADDRRICMKEQRPEISAKLESILNKEQFEKYQQFKRRGKGKMARMKKELNLSEEQAREVRSVMKSAKQVCLPNKAVREEFRSCMREQKSRIDEELKGILNEEQYAKHLEHRAERRGRWKN